MKKVSIVNNKEAAAILECAESNVANIAARYNWDRVYKGRYKYWKLSDVCSHAKTTQKKALEMLGRTPIKIEW